MPEVGNYFWKSFTLDVWEGTEWASDLINLISVVFERLDKLREF